MPSKWGHVVILAGGLVLAVGLAGCGGHATAKPATTSTPPAASAPDSAPGWHPPGEPTDTPANTPASNTPAKGTVGDTVTVSGTVSGTDGNQVPISADITVNATHSLQVVKDPSGFAELDQRATNGRFLIATITYKATSDGFDYNPLDWTVRMPDGQSYDAGAVSDTSGLHLGQELSSGTLHDGQRAKGLVTFDVPATHGLLVYSAGIDDDVAEWSF